MSDIKVDDRKDKLASILTARPGSGATGETQSMGGGQGMDRQIKKKTWTPKRIAMILGVLIFIAAVAYGFSQTTGGRTLRIDPEKVTFASTEFGPFQEYISQTGNVLPIKTIYLDAVEGGRVEEVFVREGAIVEVGQPLLRLSNNNLQLQLLNAETQRIEQVNRLENTRFQIEQNNLNLRQQVTDMNYNIQRLKREFDRNKELFDKQMVSAQEYERVRDEYEYYLRRRDLTMRSYQQDSLRQSLQVVQMESSITRMEQNFQLLQEQLANLTVRAPVSGHLTALDAEVGELRASGSRFGQIDVLDGYKVEAGVDEFYISRVQMGQTATSLPIAGVEYSMTVTRVYPEVRDGRFTIDMQFTGAIPEGIRRGQTIRFRLEMSDPTEATIVPRGGFFQTTGGNWIFVVQPDGNEAVRRNIRTGRQNTQYYEVTEGLEAGERVITSSYDTFGDADRLVW